MAHEELCRLDYADRIKACDELLLQPDLPPGDRVDVLYKKAHAYYEQDNISGALEAVDTALAVPAEGLMRAILQTSRASCLYALRRLDEMADALSEANEVSVEPNSTKAHMDAHATGLAGMLLAARGVDGAYELLLDAVSMYRQLSNDVGRDWVLLEAAKVALRAERSVDARTCLSQIVTPQYAPTARLMDAELSLRFGYVDQAEALTATVLQGVHGEVKGHHRVRALYLTALRWSLEGDALRASIFLSRAQDELDKVPRQDVELTGALNELAAQLARGREVA